MRPLQFLRIIRNKFRLYGFDIGRGPRGTVDTSNGSGQWWRYEVPPTPEPHRICMCVRTGVPEEKAKGIVMSPHLLCYQFIECVACIWQSEQRVSCGCHVVDSL